MRSTILTAGAAVLAAGVLATPGSAEAATSIPQSIDAQATTPATVLTVAGNTAVVSTPMENELQGALCRSPHTCVEVPYISQGLGEITMSSGFTALTSAIDATPGDKIVLAYSQGAMVATRWLQAHENDTTPTASGPTFVLIGNPQRKLGGSLPITGVLPATPSDTSYTVIDVARQYDGVADYPTDPTNLLAVANASAGQMYLHSDYTGVDIDDPDNLVQRQGNTTYVLVPTDELPLLIPLRQLGLTDMADQLNGPLKAMIDQGYDRSGYTTLGSDPDAQRVIGQVTTETATGSSAVAQNTSAPLTGPTEADGETTEDNDDGAQTTTVTPNTVAAQATSSTNDSETPASATAASSATGAGDTAGQEDSPADGASTDASSTETGRSSGAGSEASSSSDSGAEGADGSSGTDASDDGSGSGASESDSSPDASSDGADGSDASDSGAGSGASAEGGSSTD